MGNATTFVRNPPVGDAAAPGARATAPVFVLGSGRSGTTLLYDMLISAGGFAIFHGRTHAFSHLLKEMPINDDPSKKVHN